MPTSWKRISRCSSARCVPRWATLRRSSSIRTHHGIGYSFVSDVIQTRSTADGAPHDGPVALLRIAGRSILLGHGVNTVGRDPDCDVYVNDSSVSRVHARIVVDGADATVEDLASKNGTALRGAPVKTPAKLIDGDGVEFGSVKAQFIIRREDPSTITL